MNGGYPGLCISLISRYGSKSFTELLFPELRLPRLDLSIGGACAFLKDPPTDGNLLTCLVTTLTTLLRNKTQKEKHLL